MDYSKLAHDFAEDGILVVPQFWPQEKIKEIDAQLDRYIHEMVQTGADKSAVYEAGPERQLRNLFHMEKYDGYFADLANDHELINLAGAIFDGQPISMGVEVFAKPARVGSEVPFHQDNAYFNLVPDHALTVWVALADVTVENGCVRYLKGTHNLGDLPHRPSGVTGNSMMLSELPPGQWSEECGLIHRGDAIIHHCNTIHRSEPNLSDRDRPGLLFVYKSIRCHIDEPRASIYRQNASLPA